MANEKIASLTEQIDGVVVSIDATMSRLDVAEKEVEASIDRISENVSNMSSSVGKNLDDAEGRVRESEQEIESIVGELLKKTGDAFDELQFRLKDATGPFNEELALQLELIELGIKRVEDLDSRFKDAIIDGKTVKELLEGIDTRRFVDDMQELIKEMQRGKTTIGDTLEFLNERGGDFGKTVAGWVRAFKAGEIGLKRLKELIDGLVAQLGAEGTGFEQFLEELEGLLAGDEASS